MMTLKHHLIVFAASAAFLAAAPVVLPATAQTQMRNNCDPGDKLDSSTLPQAKKKMEAAGYTQVKDLRKGCDNYWHASAMKSGSEVFIVLSPAGQVMQEGD
jgi:peptidase YpeB-like protein